MSTEADRFWAKAAGKLRRAMKLDVSSLAEAKAELEGADAVPLTDEQINDIVERATAYEPAGNQFELGTEHIAGFDTGAVLDDTRLAMYRNRRMDEQEVERRLEAIRRSALAKTGRDVKSALDWQMEERRREMAAEQAEEIVVAMQFAAPPIDPIAVANEESPLLSLHGDNFDDLFDGMLEYHKAHDRFLLFYNTKYDEMAPAGEHHPRTRFSIAHELAHYFLEEHRDYLRSGGKPHPSRADFARDASVEREADAFAAALLMPSNFMAPMVNEEPLSVSRLQEIAACFKTSFIATAIRSVQLSDFPCALVAVQDAQTRWRFQSKPLVKAGCCPKANGRIESPVIVGNLAQLGDGSPKEVCGESPLRQWFNIGNRHHLDEIAVTEQYIPIRVMNLVLVLLTVPEDDLFPDMDD